MRHAPYTEPVTHVLIHKTSETHSYDREEILRLWQFLAEIVPENDQRGYVEYDGLSDDDRIVYVFELLDGSQLGDMFFGSWADGDQWSDLEARDENGDTIPAKRLGADEAREDASPAQKAPPAKRPT